MNRTRISFGIVMLASAGGGLGYWVGGARAAGVPTQTPLVYSGTLEENGALVDGDRLINLYVFNAASAGTQVCSTTPSAPTAVTAGRFQIPLDPACATAIHANPDLWIEVRVQGDNLGRSKLGAVPYALEADRASNAVGPLAGQIRDLVPPGTVVAFAGTTAPTGWRECDGTSLAPSAAPALFAAIGTTHGGDGVSTFQIPDYRGRFLRGFDHGAGRDPEAGARGRMGMNNTGAMGDAVGSVQADAVGRHQHTITHQGTGNGGVLNAGGTDYRVPWGPQATGGIWNAVTDENVAQETRPENASVMYIIKE